jgi:hypothetical protein
VAAVVFVLVAVFASLAAVMVSVVMIPVAAMLARKLVDSCGDYFKLVGSGLACAHPSFCAHCHAKRGAARPPAHRSFAALYSFAKKYKFTISRK